MLPDWNGSVVDANGSIPKSLARIQQFGVEDRRYFERRGGGLKNIPIQRGRPQRLSALSVRRVRHCNSNLISDRAGAYLMTEYDAETVDFGAQPADAEDRRCHSHSVNVTHIE